MAREFNDKKFNLGEPLATMLKDFCSANYNASALSVIREALSEHIDRRLQNGEMRERYEAARRTRLALPEKVVKLVSKD